MKSNSSRHFAALTISALLVGGFLSMSSAQADDYITVNLVAVNDFHGQIDDTTVQWAGTVEQLLADGSASNSLLISAGDNVGTSTPASSVQNDEPTIDLLNAVGVDVSAVGNHEFDQGYDNLVNRIMARAAFPILGANIKKADGSNALEASKIFTLSGVRVAVVGAATDTTPTLVPSDGIAGLTFGDPVAAINAETDRLKSLPESERPEVIVASIHEGAPWGTWDLEQATEASAAFRSIVQDLSPDVDAIITGHTHNTYVFDAPVPGDETRTRPVIQTGHSGENVGQIKLTVDADTGAVQAYTARNVARVTISDASLIDSYPNLANVAEIRDAAVAYAIEHPPLTEEEEAAKAAAIEAAKADYSTASASAETAKADYSTAVASSEAAQTDYSTAVDAAATAKTAYAEAAEAAATAKVNYDAAVDAANVAKVDYATGVAASDTAKADYAAAVDAATVAKRDYTTAVSASDTAKADYAEAAAAAKTAKTAYAEAIEVAKAATADYRSAVQSALGDAAESAKDEYMEAMADAEAAFAAYFEAVASGETATADYSTSVKAAESALAAYSTAVASGEAAKDAYAAAAVALDTALADYSAAVASGEVAKSEYSSAVASGQAALSDYSAAVASGEAATTEYSIAVNAANIALAAYSKAVETLNAALATLATLTGAN